MGEAMSALSGALARTRATPSQASYLVLLLAVAIFINYIDRGNLATAAPLIKDELHLSNTQIGVLGSAFFLSYTLGILFAGWLSERINAYRTIALGFALWSIATALTGFAGGFAAIIALRLLLGLGESVAYPCSSKLLADYLPAHALGGPNGLLSAGSAFGSAFGTLAGGLLMALFGWRFTFFAFGFLALIWLWPWFATTRTASARANLNQSESPPTYFRIMRCRAAWGATLGHFSNSYALYFVLSWLPLYLVKSRGFSVAGMAELGAMTYIVAGVSAIASGWLSDRLIAAGASLNRVRKTCVIGGHLGLAVCLGVCAFGGPYASIAGLVMTGIFFGMTGSTLFAIAQTLAGSRAAAKWIGLQNSLANIAGIVYGPITGLIVDRTGQFTPAFALAAGVALVGAVGWGFIVRRVEPVQWEMRAAEFSLASA